jgi:hypothetical protein
MKAQTGRNTLPPIKKVDKFQMPAALEIVQVKKKRKRKIMNGGIRRKSY